MCFLQKDVKKHQKAADKKRGRMQKRKLESTVDSRLLTEAAKRSVRVRNKSARSEQMKGRAM